MRLLFIVCVLAASGCDFIQYPTFGGHYSNSRTLVSRTPEQARVSYQIYLIVPETEDGPFTLQPGSHISLFDQGDYSRERVDIEGEGVLDGSELTLTVSEYPRFVISDGSATFERDGQPFRFTGRFSSGVLRLSDGESLLVFNSLGMPPS